MKSTAPPTTNRKREHIIHVNTTKCYLNFTLMSHKIVGIMHQAQRLSEQRILQGQSLEITTELA